MKALEVCHFCGTDFTHDHDTYLLRGPSREVNICEYCVKKAASVINDLSDSTINYRRCDICGISRESVFFGQSPIICSHCLRITIRIIQYVKFTDTK